MAHVYSEISLASFLIVLSFCCTAVGGISKRADLSNACADANGLSFLRNERLLNLYGKSATLSVTRSDTGATYNYYIGVCSNPNKELLPDDRCMVIQTEYFKGNSSTDAVRCLGRIDSAQLTDTLSLGWTELTYGNGDRYGTRCGQSARVSRIFFFCDSSAGDGTPQFIEENNDDNYCYYLFNWPTSYICNSSARNDEPECTPASGKNDEPGFLAAIIVAVLMFLCTVAMAIGVLVYCLVRKAVGQEHIPFYVCCKTCSGQQSDWYNRLCRRNRRRRKEMASSLCTCICTCGGEVNNADQSVKQPLADAEDLKSENESYTVNQEEEGLIPVM